MCVSLACQQVLHCNVVTLSGWIVSVQIAHTGLNYNSRLKKIDYVFHLNQRERFFFFFQLFKTEINAVSVNSWNPFTCIEDIYLNIKVHVPISFSFSERCWHIQHAKKGRYGQKSKVKNMWIEKVVKSPNC